MTAVYPTDLQQRVDAYLERRFDLSDGPGTDRLAEAMRYSLLAGGKRIRPVLALATARGARARPGGAAAARRARSR